MIMISNKQAKRLHTQLIQETGGIDGIRDEGLLDSALSTPFQSFGGITLYPSLMEKAARLGFGLIRNHPFLDGNKRIGTHMMLVFLALNHIELDYTQEELYTTILKVAASEAGFEELLKWVTNHRI